MQPSPALSPALASAPTVVSPSSARDRRWAPAIGLGIAAFVMLVYLVSNPSRHNFYEHFTWQAAAWLEGQAGIRYPVCPADGTPTFAGTVCEWTAVDDQPYNDFYLDVLPVTTAGGAPTGRALIPFPPLPALVLVPFVALWGLTTDAQTLAAVLGGVDVWLVWWLLGALRPSLAIRAAATLLFGLGTVFWYTSMLGTTWYFAHVVAVGLTVLAVAIALRSDRRAGNEAVLAIDADPGAALPLEPVAALPLEPVAAAPDDAGAQRLTIGSLVDEFRERLRHRPPSLIDGRQLLAGFLLGLACTARLTVIFGLPFLAFVGSGGTPLRRSLSAALGAAIPIAVLVAYNFATTGHLFHPGYEYLYQQEAYGYPELGYNPAWAIEDLRYVPQNLFLMLAGAPDVMPACDPGAVRDLFSADCPVIVPKAVGMSLLLATPAYLLAIPALLRIRRSRIVAGGAIAVAAIAFANLMHFSQGWVQFGYRFSNDFVPFALPLIVLGMMRLGRVRGIVGVLVAVSIAVNAWGVAWGLILGW